MTNPRVPLTLGDEHHKLPAASGLNGDRVQLVPMSTVFAFAIATAVSACGGSLGVDESNLDNEETVVAETGVLSGAEHIAAAQPASVEALEPRVPAGAPVRESDVLGTVAPKRDWSQQKWAGELQCVNRAVTVAHISGADLGGTSLPDGTRARFANDIDPARSTRRQMTFRVHASDPLTHAGKRCEMAAWPNADSKLPVRESFWYAFSIKIGGWAKARDDQIVSQWHNSAAGGNPFFALLVRDGKMRIEVRSNGKPATPRDQTRFSALWNAAAIDHEWYTFVVNARISPDPSDAPFLKAWRNGILVVDFKGPLGYAESTQSNYLKFGFYHWLNSNPWDMDFPVRDTSFGSVALVRDPDLAYSESSLRTYINETLQ